MFTKKNSIGLLLLFIALVIVALYLARPKANRNFQAPVTRISVEVQKIDYEDITAKITSYGMVEPRTKSSVVAQVSGRVVYVADQFRDGGFFSKGDWLLGIEKADYEIAVEIAKSNLADAERALHEEFAQGEQAKKDWVRLGKTEEAPSLVLREPQLLAAKANVRSANARLRQAELNLSRCDIRAPFDGRVLSKNVDLGQVVGGNSAIAEIFATDAVEVRLPVKNRELGLLHLSEAHEASGEPVSAYPEVKIISDLAGREVWSGNIIRTAGSIDSDSRQLYVVARIEDPYGEKAKERFPLKIGQYVTAEIEGKIIKQAITIPNGAIYQGVFVYLLRGEGVYRQEVDIAWQNEEFSLIESGLTQGDILVLTPLGRVSSGTLVNVVNAKEVGLPVAQKTSPGAPPPGNSAEQPEKL